MAELSKAPAPRSRLPQAVEAAGFIKLAIVALIDAVRIVQIVIGRDGSTGQSLAWFA